MKIVQLPPTPHRAPRPDSVAVDTVVIHSMCSPASPAPESLQSCVECLASFGVSAHYFIARDGVTACLVPPDECAWHAGASRMPPPDLRERVNDFSVGIELVASPGSEFTEAQYDALVELIVHVSAAFPLRFVVGHEDVAVPAGRKTDPGALFNWARLKNALAVKAPSAVFPGRASTRRA